MNNNDITMTLDDGYITSSTDTITIDTSSWDDSFTTSPSSIYTSSSNGNVSIEGE